VTATLVCRDLTFGYGTNPPVLTGWSWSFQAGAVTALTGPSGRGKSTLLYLLGLMLRPRAGTLLLGGHDVTRLPDRQRAALRAHRFGFVFQDAALDPSRTVLDNVLEATLYRGDDRRAATRQALDLLASLGVTVPATRRPGQVSGGQAQRIATCRALLSEPSVLLADEPTGNLDAESATAVLRAMRGVADRGGTVVVATHDHDLVTRCDSVVRL
jgi:ABC-type lipoprotein export system ATPase subunit